LQTSDIGDGRDSNGKNTDTFACMVLGNVFDEQRQTRLLIAADKQRAGLMLFNRVVFMPSEKGIPNIY
jgi:hypothetical protein